MRRSNFINKSYKDKLRATYTILVLIVLVFLGLILYFQMSVAVKPIINGVGKHTVDSVAQYLGEQFDNQGKMLELLASTEAFKNGEVKTIERELDSQMKRMGDSLLVIGYKALSGEEYFKNPNNINLPSNYENELLSEKSLTQTPKTVFDSKRHEFVSFIGTKIVDASGKTNGLLISCVSIEELTKIVNNTKFSKLVGVWIFDSLGNIILKPNGEATFGYDSDNFRQQVKTKPTGEIKIKTSKDDTNYLVYSQIPSTKNLYLAMGVDSGDFSNTMKYLLYMILAFTAIICFAIFITAHKMTNLVTRPLTRMVDIIENSDGIKFIQMPADLINSRDEIGVLANTFDKMSVNIRNNIQALNWQISERKKAEEHLSVLNDELECRVKDRTKELTKATNDLSISEDRFRVALEAAHIGLYDSDCVNNVLVVNGVFLKLIRAAGYENSDIKESDWVQFDGQLKDYVFEEDLSKFAQFGDNSVPLEDEEFYKEFRLKENPETWLSFIGQAIKKDEAGMTIRFIGVLQNITERKRTEVELKAAKEEAEEASLAKSQFLANMSHEIRTPMNAIMGLTHLISLSDLNEAQKNYVSKIEGSSTTLLRIINDILDFSKIEAGKLEIENIKFSLDKILENVSNLYTISANNKGIDINFDKAEDVPDGLIGDPLRLEQIISNLTTNAIKFTNQGDIKVGVRIIEESENNVKLHFSVTDTGIGLTKEQIDKLFTAFTQADGSMTRKYGGTGLGLTISKQLVELMQGEIWVESVYGEGATFQFTVQFEKAKDIVKLNYDGYPDLKGKKVLVVDHNKTSLTILERMLRSFSFEVSATGNPFEAIDLLKGESFDLLVIDFNLPELSGIDLYKRLVANTQIMVPKTIFVSAVGRESYYIQANQLGVKNFLVKPINQSLMFDAVMDALKGTATKELDKNYREENQTKYQRALSNKKILLVEDNDINQLVAKDILEQVGIKVSIANNGEEAIRYIHANSFDAVLMDVQMPVMDGYKATEIIRKTYSGAQLPIIAMTANALKGDRERSIGSGMNDYISKPIDPEILFETLVKWLSGKGMESSDKLIAKSTDGAAPILDSEKAIIRLGNKPEFYYDLLKKYSSGYDNAGELLLIMLESRQTDEAKRFVHTLKGVTGNIGAVKLNQFLVAFEEEYEAYDKENLTQKLVTLSNLNQELVKEIQRVIPAGNPEKEQLSGDFDFTEALNSLLEALQRARTKEIKENMHYLTVNVKDAAYLSQIANINKLIERYRFKDARAEVEKLIDNIKESNNG